MGWRGLCSRRRQGTHACRETGSPTRSLVKGRPTLSCAPELRPPRHRLGRSRHRPVLPHATARFVAADDYPIGLPTEVADAVAEQSGVDSTLFWETPGVALDQIEAFLAGVHRTAAPTRILATVLFTDIVDATGRASRLGDRRWRELLDVHDELARRLVEEFGGNWSRPPVTASWRPSTGPAERSAVRPPSGTSWAASASRSGPGCTPARWNAATATSAASPSTSPPG
jgi:hypothetical protein